MTRLILFFFSMLTLWGVTASPGSITVYMRSNGGAGLGWSATRSPKRTEITVSGSGAWNLSRGGPLSSACFMASGYCFNASTSATTTGGAALPVGSGPGTLYLYWDGLGADFMLSAGTHTGTLTVGTTVIAITLIVLPRQDFDHFVYRPGYPSGCVNSHPGYSFADTCVITDERPPSTAMAVPAAGANYADPQFGHTVTRVTPSGNNIQYGALSAFSATGKYLLTSTPSGQINVYNRGGGVAYASVGSININNSAWDPYDDERIWFLDASTIKRRELNTGATTTAADYTLAGGGGRPAMTTLTMGGTVDITDDGWWAFRDNNSLCAVNLNGLMVSNQEAQTFCTSLAPYGLTDIDFTQITQVDVESRKRYVVLLSAPKGHVFSVGATGLDYEYPLPTGNQDISVEPHSDVGQDSEGRQIFFWQWYTPYDNRYYLATAQLNKGADMTRPIEEGGGLRILYNSDSGNFFTDAHYGCTWKGVCVFTPFTGGDTPVYQISAVTAGNPCSITTAVSHGLSTGTAVQIGGAAGITSINGVFTATVTGSNSLTLNGHTCTGSYTANSAHLARNAATATNWPNRQETVIVRPGEEIRRVAVHRTKMYSGGALLPYYNTPRGSISRDGRYIAFCSNLGVPENPSVWVADTGAPQTSTRIAVTAIDAADTKAIFNYNVPAGQAAATILISASPSLSSPVVNVSDGATAQNRQHVATGLTANTDYWYRVTTGEYTAKGRFQTGGPLSGTAALEIARGDGGAVQHGATVGLGSSGASPLRVTVTRGVYYYDTGAGPRAVVVR